jgi:genome maintenance exonuclease 1
MSNLENKTLFGQTLSSSTSFKRADLDSPKQFNIVGYDKSKVATIEQINEDGVRRYVTPSGKRYPSITTVTSWQSAKAIAEWRSRVGADAANAITKKATRRGTAFHSLCENYLQNKEVIGENVAFDVKYLFSTVRHILDRIDNVHCIETRLYSDYIGVAGTTDCIAEYDNILSIIDFKTAGKIKQKKHIHNYFKQASGYAVMYEELTGIPVPQIVIIMVSDEGYEVFVEKRDNYIFDLIDLVKQYNQIHG